MKDDNKLREEAELFYFEKFVGKTIGQFDVPQLLIDFHKSQMESDAVEFAEWIFNERYHRYMRRDKTRFWSKIVLATGGGNPPKEYTTNELYQQFLKSKTDKTE